MTVKETIIRDSVHDQIFVDPIARAFLDKNEFDRLAFISQLGLASRIYPSATHNRLSHSIGTYHLSRVLLESIEKELKVEKIIKNSIMIASLCHDLGHGPFSHLWEGFLHMDPNFKGYSHEKMSCKIIRNMSNKYADIRAFLDNKEFDLDLVCDLIVGYPSEKSVYNSSKLKYAFEIMSNNLNGIDVDKLDYLKRDAQFCGHSGTVFNLDRFLLLYKPKMIQLPGDEEECLHMCLKDTEFTQANIIFSTRNCFHRSIYKHKAISGLNHMLMETLKRNEKNLNLRKICFEAFFNENPYYMEEFFNLTDPYVYQKMKVEFPEDSKLLMRISNRDLYTHLMTKHLVYDDDFTNDGIPESIIIKKGAYVQHEEIEKLFYDRIMGEKPADGEFLFVLQTFKSNSTTKDPIIAYYQDEAPFKTKFRTIKLVKSHAIFVYWTGSRSSDSIKFIQEKINQYSSLIDEIIQSLYETKP